MNHIIKLQTENQELKNNLKEIEQMLTDTAAYLNSDKFLGFDNNYVNAVEMMRRIVEIRNQIMYI